MRTLSSDIEAAKDSAGQRTFWLIDITLREDGDYEEEPFYFSSQPVEWNGHDYDPYLRSKPQVQKILGGATNGGSVKIDNTDFEFGQKVLARDRYVQGSEVIIRMAWKLADGTIEADEVFNGILDKANLNTGDNGVSLQLIGDLYNPKAVLGAFPLAQRCVHRFNVNGELSPLVDPCGWQTSQPGDPLFCDKTEDGANGCIAHGNLHRIGAIPFFASVTVTIVATSQESSGFAPVGRQREPVDVEPVYPRGVL